MPVAPGRRDQRGEAVQQFEGRQDLADAPAGSRLGALVDEMLGIDLPQPVLRKGRAGAVAQQALPPLPVVSFDAHPGVERETAAVLAAAQGFALGLIEQAASNEKADDPFAQRRLQSRQRLRAEGRLLETQARGLLPPKRTRGCVDGHRHSPGALHAAGLICVTSLREGSPQAVLRRRPVPLKWTPKSRQESGVFNLTVSQPSPCALSPATRALSETFDQLKAEPVADRGD